MEIDVILQIVTIAFSVVSVVATCIFNVIFNRKARKVNILTKERINTINVMRDSFQEIYALTSPDNILEYGPVVDVAKGYFYRPYIARLRSACNKFEAYMIPFFAQEKEMIFITEHLADCAVEYYNSKHNNKKTDEKLLARLMTLREELYAKFVIYAKAMNDYINHQADGKDYDTFSFDYFYYDLQKGVSQKENAQNNSEIEKLYQDYYNEYDFDEGGEEKWFWPYYRF